MLRRPWQEVWDHGARIPAQFMGFHPALTPGQPADFCVLRFKPGVDLPDMQTYANGETTA